MKIILIILTALILAGCAPDPRNLADAEATRLKAQQSAADASQARAQQQTEWYTKQAEREAVSREIVNAWRAAIPWLAGFVSFAVCTVLLTAAIGMGYAAIGMGKATATAAMIAARTIPLDPRTGQYPMFLPEGKNILIDANTALAMLTDAAAPPNDRMIESSTAIRVNGITTRNAHPILSVKYGSDNE